MILVTNIKTVNKSVGELMDYTYLGQERDLEEQAVEMETVKILVARSQSSDLYFSSQSFYCKCSNVEYYAVRFAKLGEVCFTDDRELMHFAKADTRQYSSVDNAVHVRVNTRENVAKFGPGGQIKSTQPGLGLGSYALARVIAWLQENHPEARVEPGMLSSADVKNDIDNKERRHRFYSGRGFEVSYSDDEGNGRFWSDKTTDLIPRFDQDRISILSLPDFAKAYFELFGERIEAEKRKNLLDKRVAYLEERKVKGLQSWLTCSVLLNIAVIGTPLILWQNGLL